MVGLLSRPLAPGTLNGVVAPAAPVQNRSAVLRGTRFWEERGFRVTLAPGLSEKSGYFAGAAAERAATLNAMFADPEVGAIHTLWGGYGSTQLIPFLDWNAIRANPKPFIGRSDITSLHLALTHFAGMVSFYGPGLAHVAPAEASTFAQEGLIKALTQKAPLGPLPRHPKDGFLRVLTPGRATAPLAGGCLWPLCKSIGTPWQPDLRGKIFFWEEIGEPPWSIDAHLTHLKQAGVLEGIAGVVIGRLVDCEWSAKRAEMPSEFALEEVLEAHFLELDVPVLYGVPVGHENDALTLPLGVRATIDGEHLSIDESAFAA